MYVLEAEGIRTTDVLNVGGREDSQTLPSSQAQPEWIAYDRKSSRSDVWDQQPHLGPVLQCLVGATCLGQNFPAPDGTMGLWGKE